MLRFLLAPRRVGLHAGLALVVVVFLLLAQWQWGRAQEVRNPPDPAPVALSGLLTDGGALRADAAGRRAQATGSYDPAQQYLVPGRSQGGRPGAWVLTPLLLPATGARPVAALLVVRGFVPDGARPPAPPAGTVQVSGRLEPSEEPEGGRRQAPPDPATKRTERVSTAALAQVLPYRVHTPYLAASAESPALSAPIDRVTTPGPTGAHRSSPFSNTSYAVLWWVFAGFAVLMWVRILRAQWVDEHIAPADDAVRPEPTTPQEEPDAGARH